MFSFIGELWFAGIIHAIIAPVHAMDRLKRARLNEDEVNK